MCLEGFRIATLLGKLTSSTLLLLVAVGSIVDKVHLAITLARANQPERFAAQAREWTGICFEDICHSRRNRQEAGKQGKRD